MLAQTSLENGSYLRLSLKNKNHSRLSENKPGRLWEAQDTPASWGMEWANVVRLGAHGETYSNSHHFYTKWNLPTQIYPFPNPSALPSPGGLAIRSKSLSLLSYNTIQNPYNS